MYASFPYVYIEETDEVILLVVHLSNDLPGQHETSMFAATWCHSIHGGGIDYWHQTYEYYPICDYIYSQ